MENSREPSIPLSVRREHPEPVGGNAPLPSGVIIFCILMSLVAGAYLALSLSAPDPVPPNIESPTAPSDPQMLGKRVFAQNCSACHQPTGLGTPRLFPPLAGSEWVLGSNGIGDNHLVAILLHGLQGPIDVNGYTFNNSMPPWNHLSDEQIAAVLTFIRTQWGNSAPAILVEFVKTVRVQTSARPNPWSQKDLRGIPPTAPAH